MLEHNNIFTFHILKLLFQERDPMIIPIVYPSAAQFWLNNDLLHRAGQQTDLKDMLVNLPPQYLLNTEEKSIRILLLASGGISHK